MDELLRAFWPSRTHINSKAGDASAGVNQMLVGEVELRVVNFSVTVCAQQEAFFYFGADFASAAIRHRPDIKGERFVSWAQMVPSQCRKVTPVTTTTTFASGFQNQLILSASSPCLLATIVLMADISVLVLAFAGTKAPLPSTKLSTTYNTRQLGFHQSIII